MNEGGGTLEPVVEVDGGLKIQNEVGRPILGGIMMVGDIGLFSKACSAFDNVMLVTCTRHRAEQYKLTIRS